MEEEIIPLELLSEEFPKNGSIFKFIDYTGGGSIELQCLPDCIYLAKTKHKEVGFSHLRSARRFMERNGHTFRGVFG